MADPENLVLVLMRELRAERDRQDEERRALERRFESVRQAVQGESFLGRCLAAEIEDQLAAIRERLNTLEARS